MDQDDQVASYKAAGDQIIKEIVNDLERGWSKNIIWGSLNLNNEHWRNAKSGDPYRELLWQEAKRQYEKKSKQRQATDEQQGNATDENDSALNSLLTEARNHYAAHERALGDQKAAQWLIHHRSIKTTDKARMYVYNKTAGHYEVQGDLILKADLIDAFGPKANRTRIAEVLSRVQALSYSGDEELNKSIPPNLIPLTNGIYDLKTNALLPHSPKHFFTYVHPVSYDANAKSLKITQFIRDIVGAERDQELLLDIVALCLFRGRITPNFFILVGWGRNGKSLFLKILRMILGKLRVVSINPQALAEDVFAAAQLLDRHANIGADIPGGIIRDASVLKAVTGGDGVSVQRKGVDRVDIDPYCEFVWASNEPPRIMEDTRAIWERLVVIHFPYTFCSSPKKENEKQAEIDIEEKLLSPEELSGLLNIALERLPRLLATKRLSVQINSIDMRKEYRVLSDTPAVFVDERCEEVEYEPSDNYNPSSGYLTAAEAYNEYRVWCKEVKCTAVSAKRFGSAMEAMGFEKAKDNQVRSYRGIKFKAAQGQVGHIGQISPILPVCDQIQEDSKEKTVLTVPSVIYDTIGETPEEAKHEGVQQQQRNNYDNLSKNSAASMAKDLKQYLAKHQSPVPLDDLYKIFPGSQEIIITLLSDGVIYEPKHGYISVLDTGGFNGTT